MGFGGGAFLVRVVILTGLMFPGKARVHAVTYLYYLLFVFQITYPIVMGWIDDTFHWNFAFLLDLPFLAIGAIMVWKFVPRGHLFLRKKEASVDFTGAILLIVSLGCLQLATSRGERDDWFDSSWITISLIVSVIALALFFWWDSRVQNVSPVFHLRMIWRQGAIRTSFSVVLIVGAILGAGLFVIPQYLRTVQDYSAMQTGAFISMFTAGLGSGLIVSLRILVPKLGGPLAITTGLLMLLATFAAIAYIWTPTTPTHILAIAIFLQGFSLAPTLLGAANIATGSALPADLNDVSTMFFFVRQLGNTLGVSAATVTFDRRLNLHSARLLDVANRLDPTVHSTLGTYSNLIHRNGGGGANPALGALQLFQNNVIIQSRLLSYIDIYVGLAVLGALGLIVLAFTKFKNRLGPHSFHLW
jgi:DHA2 family multidrug resistance protein